MRPQESCVHVTHRVIETKYFEVVAPPLFATLHAPNFVNMIWPT